MIGRTATVSSAGSDPVVTMTHGRGRVSMRVSEWLSLLGEPSGRSLTVRQVAEIRRLYAAGYRAADIADRFGVSVRAVFRIASRETWDRVEVVE